MEEKNCLLWNQNKLFYVYSLHTVTYGQNPTIIHSITADNIHNKLFSFLLVLFASENTGTS